MNISKYIFALAAVTCIAFSCKKDDNEDNRKSLLGALSVTLPEFVNPGDVFYFDPDNTIADNAMKTTIRRADGDPGTLGYFFTVSELKIIDTLRALDGKIPAGKKSYRTLQIPDTLCTITPTIRVSSEDYYDKSARATSTIVKTGLNGESSITGFELYDKASFTDPRDGKSYYIMTYAGKTWMRQNLAYQGIPYGKSAAMADIFGSYYTWEEARNACPAGWRVPTAAEWATLGTISSDLKGDVSFNGEKMWEFWPETKATDKTHFTSMPTGYATIDEGDFKFSGLNEYAMYWCDDNGRGEIHYIYTTEPEIKSGLYPNEKDFAASLRCIKE